MKEAAQAGYEAWLRKRTVTDQTQLSLIMRWTNGIVLEEDDRYIQTAASELAEMIAAWTGRRPSDSVPGDGGGWLRIGTFMGSSEVARAFSEEEMSVVQEDGFRLRRLGERVLIAGMTGRGVLYGAFAFLRLMQTGDSLDELDELSNPANSLRLINQWDNVDGSIERGYSGQSIFYAEGEIVRDLSRVRDYARLLASVGINGIVINNVNVHKLETMFLTEKYLPRIVEVANVFRTYGIRLFLSINFAAPIELGDLPTADPLDEAVKDWWKERARELYGRIPDFGGFLVKADSEFRPGPFTYGRDHADGANMLAEALAPYGGLIVWRCFVYNCNQDWRDRKTDRARAAYDHFTPLDGRFMDNVVLQVKNGPMDFQVREPVSPLFGAMPNTNMLIEFQITQEYTGQQRHLCYLVPQWKEALDFDTYLRGEGSTVKKVADGSLFGRPLGGFAAVSNIGSDANWTGHPLAQANLYGYGRLAWDPDLSADGIAVEWTKQTFGHNDYVIRTVLAMLMSSWGVYESYTAPLGVGWMVKPNHHYGPDVDGYEYSMWGTYHFADCRGIGVDRSVHTGTGYAGQYHSPHSERFESAETTPDELLLFFHHVPYRHRLHSGKTVIQHIYDTHFEGAERAEELVDQWEGLKGYIDHNIFEQGLSRFQEQAEHAKEWRDVINTYFWRKSGIADEQGRTLY
ncbi:alpha-glucuronidase [Paenibacillus yonginensis]|uniref:Xylan alpha-1,2-glucuronidase n=1 Tax=Paenibacillus yonginensis TaxID=1462996 RepID=A0A1B1MZS0_9BACL|nr:alpha-glucuronidase family glycosyl hydrolase [Paenibacillus yonginensis]ANS74672.1 alpha-glucuronidase [Paenibacillus yonginensis]